jgi:hypothetical protein
MTTGQRRSLTKNTERRENEQKETKEAKRYRFPSAVRNELQMKR